MVGWLPGRNGMVEENGRGELLNPWQLGSKQRREEGQVYTFPDHLQ